jgi:PadR family transcriptional regulator, regulatory protein PadR
MPAPQTDLLQGTLDLLILKALTLQELHGMGVSKFYSLTKAGKKQLHTESERWERISLAMATALRTT